MIKFVSANSTEGPTHEIEYRVVPYGNGIVLQLRNRGEIEWTNVLSIDNQGKGTLSITAKHVKGLQVSETGKLTSAYLA